MTEKKYIQSFVRESWKIWAVALVVGLILGYVVAQRLKPTYEGAVSFQVSKLPALAQSDADFYLYDGYYNDQSALTVRNNLAAWIKSPRTVNDVFVAANVSVPEGSTDSLSRYFKIKDTTQANLVDVVFTAAKSEDAQRVGKSLITMVKQGFVTPQLALSSTEPLVVMVNPAKEVAMVGVALALTAIAFVFTLLKHYFRNE